MTKSHREQGLDYRDGVELSWCPSWSNRLWQGWSCGLGYCPGGNATDLIWRVLASSDGISSWTPLKPQHSNPNSNPLANQHWCSDFLPPPTPLIIPHRLPAFLVAPIYRWGYYAQMKEDNFMLRSSMFKELRIALFRSWNHFLSFFLSFHSSLKTVIHVGVLTNFLIYLLIEFLIVTTNRVSMYYDDIPSENWLKKKLPRHIYIYIYIYIR